MIGTSMNIEEEKIKLLKEVLPEVFTEGKIDCDKLKATLGEHIDFTNERYVLNWAGKSEAFRVLQSLSTKTLVPSREESLNFDETNNIFIEGENLEVLKVLQKSYFGKIKMIYIDPPYNTGNDSFIYPDKFSETLCEYQKRVGDKDEDGYMVYDSMFRKNSKENGQYHSNWLNMMMPRLYLARNLLRQDGVIFISIDDNEVHNLRLLCNEIFGEENFLGQITVKSNPSGRDYGGIAQTHDYVIIYGKNETELNLIANPNKNFQYRDDISDFDARELRNRNIKFNASNRPNLCYPFFVNLNSRDDNGLYDISLDAQKDWVEVMPLISQGIQTVWRWGKDKVRANINVNVKAKLKIDGNFMIIEKYRSNLERTRSILEESKYRNESGTLKLKEIFEGKPFDYPKSLELIKLLVMLGLQSNDIILDFFAGSGTTAHAVMELNKEDGGNRKYICVQLPEQCEETSSACKFGYKTIADVCKERIRRVSRKIANELMQDNNSIDLGFKVFKLADSNFKQWQQVKDKDTNKLLEQMDFFVDPVAEHATTENMIYEFLLKSGKSLNSDVKQCGDYITVNENELILVLETINQNILTEIIAKNPQKVIVLDKLFTGNDQLKTNISLQMKDANIEFKAV